MYKRVYTRSALGRHWGVESRAHFLPMSDAPPPLIALHQVHKRFDGGLEALRGVSLDVRAGEFVALLGP